jgi:hypothetical protein
MSRRNVLKIGAGATGISAVPSIVGAQKQDVQKSRRKKFQAAMKIREARGRDAMLDFLRANGYKILENATASRNFSHGSDDVSTMKIEKDDLELNVSIFYDTMTGEYYADTDFVARKNSGVFGGDNGEAPEDIVGIGWESSDYDRVVGNPKGNPGCSSICSLRQSTSSGIGWNVDDYGECCVDEGEVVWEGWANCEVVPESGTTQSERTVSAYYYHTWMTDSDVESISFGLDGSLTLTFTQPTEKKWDTPVKATDNTE